MLENNSLMKGCMDYFTNNDSKNDSEEEIDSFDDVITETRNIVRDDRRENDFIAGIGIAATIFTTGFLVCKLIYGGGK